MKPLNDKTHTCKAKLLQYPIGEYIQWYNKFLLEELPINAEIINEVKGLVNLPVAKGRIKIDSAPHIEMVLHIVHVIYYIIPKPTKMEVE